MDTLGIISNKVVRAICIEIKFSRMKINAPFCAQNAARYKNEQSL